MSVTLPQDRAILTDKDSRTTRDFYKWMAGVTSKVNAIPGDASSDITAIATKLGSPDGTVANIPDQSADDVSMVQAYGISITGAGTVGSPWLVGLREMADSGAGEILGITRDSYGRISGSRTVTTDDLTEGATNLYFTDARAIAAVGAASAPTVSLPASETIPDNSAVNRWDDAGTQRVRLADSADRAKPCNGWVVTGVASGATATVALGGLLVTGLASLTPGARVFLAGGGTVSATAPTGSGTLTQPVGYASSATELYFNPSSTLIWRP